MRLTARLFTGIFLIIFMMGYFPVSRASSFGMIEGPPGCTWDATVIAVSGAQVKIRLEKMYGSCMYEPGPCGSAGDVLSLPNGKDKPAKAGDALQVWVDADADSHLRASLEPPVCTRKPPP